MVHRAENMAAVKIKRIEIALQGKVREKPHYLLNITGFIQYLEHYDIENDQQDRNRQKPEDTPHIESLEVGDILFNVLYYGFMFKFEGIEKAFPDNKTGNDKEYIHARAHHMIEIHVDTGQAHKEVHMSPNHHDNCGGAQILNLF
jgi:hypothetical protein